MSSKLIKKYIDILMEAMSLNTLQDAGDAYAPGEAQVWYWKESIGHEMMKGYKALQRENKLPNLQNLEATHVLIGTLAETDPEKVWSLMQAENWSPQGQANEIIKKSRTGHTSMAVGDIIVVKNSVYMADQTGFVDLASGEEI